MQAEKFEINECIIAACIGHVYTCIHVDDLSADVAEFKLNPSVQCMQVIIGHTLN